MLSSLVSSLFSPKTATSIIGIDLGTTYSGVAIFHDGLPEMIENDQGAVLIPSLVAFNRNQILVGDEVSYQMAFNPENSIYEVKRLMGKRFNEESVQEDIKTWPFKVVEHEDQIKIQVKVDKKDVLFTPEALSANIIRRLKQTSEHHLKTSIKDVVISVPAHFNNNQKSATKDAGIIAGLNVVKIISEPTAAALAYGLGIDEKDQISRNIVVYDLGGGTFDVSILNISGREFKVLSISGSSHLGGEDFTNRMVTHLLQEFEKKHNITLSNVTKLMRHRLRESSERAKRKLSASNCKETNIELDNFFINQNAERIDYYTTITREKFNSINKDLFEQSIELVRQCLNQANLTETDIHEVILVGGSTRVPRVLHLLEELFSPEKINRTVDPDTAVALGCAIEGAILSGDNCEAIQNTKLFDVTPLSLGIGTSDDFEMMSFCVKRNSMIPLKETRRFTTAHDNQRTGRFPVYEGEREFAKDNFYLGDFTICGIPRGPAGSIACNVTFDINMDGILNVTAIETSTGKSAGIEMKHEFGRLNEEQIADIIKTAEQLDRIDKITKTTVTKQRDLERYSYDISNYLTLESTQNNISARNYNVCRIKNDEVLRFLSDCQNATKEDFEKWLNDLKSTCHESLNDLFKQDKGRNIGQFAELKIPSSSQQTKPKTLFEVD